VNFFIFGLVRFTLAQLTLSPPFQFPGAASPPVDIITPLRRVTLHSHGAKTCSLSLLHLLATLHPVTSPLASQTKIEALNPHHRYRPPSADSLTPIIHCYKKIILTLATLPTTQPCLHFASSLARASHHWSFTHPHRSLSPPSHAHRPSAQWHPPHAHCPSAQWHPPHAHHPFA
jgi:hypothetical protein